MDVGFFVVYVGGGCYIIKGMDDSEKVDRGAIIAATLLQIFCAPFILVTVIVALLLGFVPFIMAIEGTGSVRGSSGVINRLYVYGIFMTVLIVFYSVSTGMMKMAEMIKAAHSMRGSKSAKSMLYEFTDNLLVLVSLELILGGVMGAIVAVIQLNTLPANAFIMDICYVLLILLILGASCVFIKNYILGLDWWRR
ncbi:MAG: hypothetical protein ACSHX6_16425 [Akkermansiaceae bacterium]